jgi:ABC-type Mn2+/Zn2+ transport system permease subunit
LAVGCVITVVLFAIGHYSELPTAVFDPRDARTAALLYGFMTAILIGLVSSFWVTRQNGLE